MARWGGTVALALLLMGAATQDKDLSVKVDELIRKHGLDPSKAGVFAGSAAVGTLVARNADARLIPASNMKLVTTAFALLALGEAFAFRTEIYLDGEVRDGVLEGNLVVRADGDPNLSGRFFDKPTAVFEQWKRALGLRRIAGSLVLVDDRLEMKDLHPDWEGNDFSRWYCAPVRGHSLNDNCVDLTVTPGELGGACRVELSPATKYVTIDNGTTTAAKPKKPLAFWRKPGTNEIALRGELGPKSAPLSFSCTVHNPARYFGTALLETLGLAAPIEERASMPGSLKGRTPAILHEFDLKRTLQACNRRSQNFYAEMLLKRAGGGSWESGAKAIGEFLSKLGIDGAVVRDGSGLSRQNRLSARDLATVLLHMRKQTCFETWLASLAGPGDDGTLRKRLVDLAGAMRAKTGTLTGASSLSGYVTTAGGAEIAFSVIVNGKGDGEEFQDDFVRLLASLRLD